MSDYAYHVTSAVLVGLIIWGAWLLIAEVRHILRVEQMNRRIRDDD